MSFRAPDELATDLDALEAVERVTTRLIAQAVYNLLDVGAKQFSTIEVGSALTSDAANYLGEDVTRMALDAIGTPRIPNARLFGAVDYKLAAYVFLTEFAVRQALFIDSKSEMRALNVARIQMTQTSLEVRQLRGGNRIAVRGLIAPVVEVAGERLLSTTAFVKYHYDEGPTTLDLRQVSVVTLPNGLLQSRYNPTPDDGIWNAGPDAPTRGEKFRTRLNFRLLEDKARWRIQRMVPGQPWEFQGD
jgi:predicted transcriptional regulator